jgi:hypothetical protein
VDPVIEQTRRQTGAIQCAYTSDPISRKSEIDIEEVFLTFCVEEGLSLRYFRGRSSSLSLLYEVDLSSVWPHFEPKSGTSLEETTQSVIPAEMLEHDVVLRMPPKRQYTIQLEVKRVIRAEPKIVEPDWI